jgi:xylulokinase
VLEGVAFALRDSLDLVRSLGGGQGAARVSGGGARSELWLRILSSVLQVPLERPQVEEGAAYGAAMLGGVAGGVWSTMEDAIAACVKVRATVEPDPDWVGTYKQQREHFQALYPAVRPLSP